MPKEGASVRAEQIELMASLTHAERTSPAYKAALTEQIDLKTGAVLIPHLLVSDEANLREWRRDYLIATALPAPFVKAFAKLTADAMPIWAEARKNNDFAHFAPTLEKIVEMSREKAQLLGGGAHPYDALLDLFEPETTTTELDTLFASVKTEISALLKKIQAAPQIDNSCLHGKFCGETQLRFGRELLEAMGYDLNKGRLDLSTHPFSMSIHPSDSRVTTRLHTSSIFDSISAVLHEGGHSLYEMGLLPEYYGSPLCEAVSLGIHESQSRLWETRVGQSKAFWTHFLPKLVKHFPELKDVPLDTFYKAINRVQPSLIRVESDEVTYSLHVIVRFELEKKLIEGSLEVRDLPTAWNDKMEELLGVRPKRDSEGCLQDIHWSMGAFGYFPTYALGNLYASQFFGTFEKTHPDWEQRVEKGELTFIKEWLNTQIHRHGRTYRAKDLVHRVTGEKLSPAPYITYLTKKYQELYGITP